MKICPFVSCDTTIKEKISINLYRNMNVKAGMDSEGHEQGGIKDDYLTCRWMEQGI